MGESGSAFTAVAHGPVSIVAVQLTTSGKGYGTTLNLKKINQNYF
jgi:hypothetical protein